MAFLRLNDDFKCAHCGNVGLVLKVWDNRRIKAFCENCNSELIIDLLKDSGEKVMG
jgi:transcription elongation factor Elf1